MFGLIIFFHPGEYVVVPDELVEELADLRVAFAMLLRKYEKELHSSLEAQQEFVAFLEKLFPRKRSSNHSFKSSFEKLVEEKISSSNHSFKSSFDKLVEEKISLFNIHYLKRICSIFPKDIW